MQFAGYAPRRSAIVVGKEVEILLRHRARRLCLSALRRGLCGPHYLHVRLGARRCAGNACLLAIFNPFEEPDSDKTPTVDININLNIPHAIADNVTELYADGDAIRECLAPIARLRC